MIAKSHMLYGFADEMEKIAKAKPKDEDLEPNLNTFERHPKKILGGVAALAGGALLAKKLKRKIVPGIPVPKHLRWKLIDE